MKDRKKDYELKRDTKRVSFNIEKDADIIAYIKDKEFSTYVKSLILKEMEKMKFCAKNENVSLTVENLDFYAKKIIELNESLKETITGEHPQDALSLLIQIDDALDTMKRWAGKHVTEDRAEKHWSAVAKVKQREM